jgi:CHASE2 domain-containing sensor protein
MGVSSESPPRQRRKGFNHIRNVFRGVLKSWRGLSSGKRRLVSSIALAVAVHLLLESVSSAGWRRQAENAAIDWMMSASAHRISTSRPPDAKVAFTVLDIDDESYTKWNEPLFTPRDKLLELIKFAVLNGARIVIVDVDLTNKTGPINDTAPDGRDASSDDMKLADFLKNPFLKITAIRPERQKSAILLVRDFKVVSAPNSRACREPRHSFLEQNGFGLSSNVYFASVKFEQEEDQVIRQWRLWERICGTEKPDFVPSVELLTVMLLNSSDKDPDPHSGFRDFAATIPAEDQRTCQWPGEDVRTWKAPGGIELSSARSGISERIIYRIRWQDGAGGRGWPLVRLPDGSEVPSVMRFSARTITDPDAEHPSPPKEAVVNRVVMIGNSSVEGRDWHGTPLGAMPGELILVNSIDSLSRVGQLKLPSCITYYLSLLGTTALMVWTFSRLHQFWAMLVSGVAIILILLPISYIYFQRGYWSDYAIPLVAVLFHNMAEEFKEAAGHLHPDEE